MASSNSSSGSSERDVSFVILLTTLQSFCVYIYMPSLGVFVEDPLFSSIFPMRVIHSPLTLQSLGLSLIRQRYIVLISSYGVPSRNEGMYKVDYLRAFSESTRRCFGSVLDVASSDVI